jgi:EAL domain-containing protein (putative c-di-GMP-specific phosphodiesterase class I)
MTKKTESREDHVSVNIHEGFYLNRSLSLPTVIMEYAQVESILRQLQYVACITVRIEQLNEIEYKYGSVTYNNLLGSIAGMLKDLKSKVFRKQDIMVVDLFDIDTFVIFLSPPRHDRTRLLYHLEGVTERIRSNIQDRVFDLFYSYVKEYHRPTIGYALVLHNPMINTMRLIMQLIGNSKKMGGFLAHKHDHVSKYSLQKLIIEQEIQTVFQPIVDLRNGEIVGYESLSRGPADTEFAKPLLLFLLAAKYDLSFELDRLCRKKTLERVHNLKTDKKIFVNTLSMTIHDPEFRGVYLKELLDDLKIKPENVVFEVSEQLAIDNFDLFREAMKDYSDIGIVHAYDDLGKGHSALERIMELNPGYMKIDISFVRDIDKSYVKQEIVKALVNLAENINSQVIAEGVETREEYKKLQELNVAYGQGFFFARPSEKLITARTW